MQSLKAENEKLMKALADKKAGFSPAGEAKETSYLASDDTIAQYAKSVGFRGNLEEFKQRFVKKG